MKRKLLLLISVLIFAGSLTLLATGSWLLFHPLFIAPSVPLGTITTWAGLIALPCIVFYSIKGFHPASSEFMWVFRSINLIIIFLAFCWGIVSYFLAGNWAFHFSGQAIGFTGSERAFRIFQQYSIFVLILPLVLILVFIVGRAYVKRKKAN